MSRRILVVFGTRPEAIKVAPVVRALREMRELGTVLCVTAQHRELLDQVCGVFGLSPDIDLDLMEHGQSLAAFASRALVALDGVYESVAPDLVLAQGDTTTVLAAAQCAYYRRVAFGHIEAGLRTYNKWSPFPEEYNRTAVGVLADLHFAPTERARANLLGAGVPAGRIHVTGNPVVDAVQYAAGQPCDDEALGVPPEALAGEPLLLVTTHRRENLGRPMRNICAALRTLLARWPRAHCVLPVHPNPAVREVVEAELGGVARMHLVRPPAYLAFVHLMQRARLVLTDSGGVQEEAPALGRPVLVLRDTTERPEGIEAGTARLVGTDEEDIVREAARLLEDERAYAAMARAKNPYGDGTAGTRIAELCRRFLADFSD